MENPDIINEENNFSQWIFEANLNNIINDPEFSDIIPKVESHPIHEIQHPSIISNEEYPGPLNFQAFIDPHTSKRPWVYSPVVKKMYILPNSNFPIDFKWNHQNTNDVTFFVRAMPLFSLPQDAHKPVPRCIHHAHENDVSNKGLPSDIRQHIIRCKNEHAKYEGEFGKHLSVIVPLGQPQMGSDTIRQMYEFVCQNSCPSGMNRKPIEVVFTLEDEIGNLWGRTKVNVRICSCPKRDKEKEEKEYYQKNGFAKPPPGKKRKHEHSEKKPISFSEGDINEYEVKFKIVGKQNWKAVMKYAHDLMCGEMVQCGSEEPYKKCIKDINNIIKTTHRP